MHKEAQSLTDNEIAMLKNKHGVILFHMDGCGHCVNMMPAWNSVMDELKDDMENEIILGAVERSNIEKFHQHGIKPNVNGFPTILYFNPSNLHSPEVYNGDRSYEDFKKWIMEKSKKGKGKSEKMKVAQKGGSRRRRSGKSLRSRRNRVKRLRLTRKHRRTNRRRAHVRCKHCASLDIKSGGGCKCGLGLKLW